jgi:hypothetical protein
MGIAFGAFALSSFVSALRIGHWILNADPRAIINAGRWSLICLTLLALAVLLWLVSSGRWTHAMLLAAFILPVLVQAAPRWRLLLGPVDVFVSNPSGRAKNRYQSARADGLPSTQDHIDHDLVERSAAVLKVYLEQTRRQIAFRPKGSTFEIRSENGSPLNSGRRRMSIGEALDVLGLQSSASPDEVREAQSRRSMKPGTPS